MLSKLLGSRWANHRQKVTWQEMKSETHLNESGVAVANLGRDGLGPGLSVRFFPFSTATPCRKRNIKPVSGMALRCQKMGNLLALGNEWRKFPRILAQLVVSPPRVEGAGGLAARSRRRAARLRVGHEVPTRSGGLAFPPWGTVFYLSCLA